MRRRRAAPRHPSMVTAARLEDELLARGDLLTAEERQAAWAVVAALCDIANGERPQQ